MRRPHPALACFSLLALAPASPALAQVKASEPASLSQTVDGTTITLEYARPRVRGRDTLFGGVVHWGEVWTPGANWATTLELNKDVQVNGYPVPKGKYSVWMVVRPGNEWTVVLDPRHRKYHVPEPDSTAEQIRFPVTPEAGPFTEVLTWAFPVVKISGTTLTMQWGTVRTSLEIAVAPSYQLAFPENRSAAFLGRYRFSWAPGKGFDSISNRTFTVSWSEGSLRGVFAPELFPGWGEVILLPIGDTWFNAGFVQNGELYEIDRDMVLEFDIKGGRARGFDLRGEGDAVLATGQRQ